MKGAVVVIVIVLLVFSCVGPASALADPPAWVQGVDQPVKRRPVILIHGLGSSPAAWGWAQHHDEYAGLYRRLVDAGYEPDRSLFVLDYSAIPDPDYVEVARRQLAPLVNSLLDRGASHVDLVGHSYGGLVARYFADNVMPGTVSHLVLIASPNHGSYAATALRLQGELDRQIALRAAQPHPVPSTVESSLPSFVSAGQFVHERMDRFYLPLYLNFSRQGLFLQLPSQRTRRQIFESWLVEHVQGWTTQLEALAQQTPDVQRPPKGSATAVPDDQLGLSLAYYDLLAMHAARAVQLRYTPVVDELVRGAYQDFELRPTWQETLLNFLANRLASLVSTKGVEWVKALFRTWLIDRVEAVSSTGAPTGHAMNRLVDEQVSVVWNDTSVLRRSAGINANSFLNAWNAQQFANLSVDPASYQALHVVGLATTPWTRVVTPQVREPTDAAVAVSEALFPLDVEDSLVTVRGTLEGLHNRLVTNGNVGTAVQDFLEDIDPGAAASAPTNATARLFTPSYVPVGPLGPSERLQVTLGADAGALSWLEKQGLGFAVWVRPQAESMRRNAAGITVPATGWRKTDSWWSNLWGARSQQVLLGPVADAVAHEHVPLALGYRLVPLDGWSGPRTWGSAGRPVVDPGRQGVDHEPQLRLKIKVVRVTTPLSDRADVVEPDSSPRIELEKPFSTDPVLPSTPPDGTNTDKNSTPEPEQPTGTGAPQVVDQDDGSIPLVRVERHSNLITQKHEKRIYHARWQWNFGDGSTQTVDGKEHASYTASHVFAIPGEYDVRATSLANDGRLLRTIKWHVTARDDASLQATTVTRSFTARSVEEPNVQLRLTGPRTWVTGKPALYRIELKVDWPPEVQKVFVRMYPGRQFEVQWARPGTFVVRGAVYLRMSYWFGDDTITVYNTYVTEKDVQVLATSIH